MKNLEAKVFSVCRRWHQFSWRLGYEYNYRLNC